MTADGRLYQCESEAEHVQWTVKRLLRGSRVHDTMLWLGGVDRPVRVIGQAKAILRAQGVKVISKIEQILDCENKTHDAICWRVEYSL